MQKPKLQILQSGNASIISLLVHTKIMNSMLCVSYHVHDVTTIQSLNLGNVDKNLLRIQFAVLPFQHIITHTCTWA